MTDTKFVLGRRSCTKWIQDASYQRQQTSLFEFLSSVPIGQFMQGRSRGFSERTESFDTRQFAQYIWWKWIRGIFTCTFPPWKLNIIHFWGLFFYTDCIYLENAILLITAIDVWHWEIQCYWLQSPRCDRRNLILIL